jgi:hypothetical protein
MNSTTVNFARAGCIFAGMLLVGLTGCQSGKFTSYISPQLTGRVLAADTREPLAHASVQRGGANQNFVAFGPPKGGQLLMQPSPAHTDADGRFVLDSKGVLAPFRQPGWVSVSITFSHSGYETFRTNYTGANVTSHAEDGVPVVNTGDVLLQPLGK